VLNEVHNGRVKRLKLPPKVAADLRAAAKNEKMTESQTIRKGIEKLIKRGEQATERAHRRH
jgi:hypothetical protein